ncbi:hypothetical protein [Ruegeria conchae]|uniref:hypothetical protein n=1 Tax=Ruegeria conchae TaxID=981384 RepID=UPI0029C99F13|nr:hypothetical protein [Ruegeria conchae]
MKHLIKGAVSIVFLAVAGATAIADEKTHSYIFLGEETILTNTENCVYTIMEQGVEIEETESQMFHELAQGIILVYAQKYVGYRSTGKVPDSYTEEEAEILQSGEIDEFFEHCFE